MLHKETVERSTFELLTTLMQDEKLSQFNLAGGTALALHIGHRKSVDLDLFTQKDFSESELSEYLTKKYNFINDFQSKNTLKGYINNVMVDCITHKYENVKPIINEQGIRLYSVEDISAMKLNAIADNGTRLKDFIDIACLSNQMSFKQMLQAYEHKYPSSNSMRAVRGVLYHDDIIKEPIYMLKGRYDWSNLESRLNEMVKNENVKFITYPFDEGQNLSRKR